MDIDYLRLLTGYFSRILERWRSELKCIFESYRMIIYRISKSDFNSSCRFGIFPSTCNTLIFPIPTYNLGYLNSTKVTSNVGLLK